MDEHDGCDREIEMLERELERSQRRVRELEGMIVHE